MIPSRAPRRFPRRAPVAAVLACLAAGALAPAAAAAQQVALRAAAPDTVPRRSAAWRADSMAVAGDSVGALALLDSAVRANRADAAAWHRRGMIAWAMARSQRSASFIRDGKAIRQLRLADSSLRLAHRLAPNEPQYAVDLGRFFLNSDLATLRWQAHGIFEDAVARADTAAGGWSVAEASDELGMSHWRRYEAVANRRLVTGAAGPPSVDAIEGLAHDLPSRLKDFLDNFTVARDGDDWSGQLDYDKALGLFERALRAEPNYPRARRHVYMALAERERWEELERLTTARVRTAPWDADAHLALGLAAHRGGRDVVAQAAFDSALAILPAAERARLTSLARILRTAPRPGRDWSDSASYAAAAPDERALLDSLYWQLADPLALTPANEARVEFLARVAFAELRWTSDDLDRKGADTDRGEIWIRYGPPDVRAGFGAASGGNAFELWRWNDGLAFVFITPPTWGTARLAPESHHLAEEVTALAPVQWTNLPIARRIDSLDVQLARFRAPGDSADLLMVAELPVARLVKGTELARAPVDVGVGIYTGPSYVLFRDSTRVIVSAGDSTAPPELRSWRQRLPAGEHVYRVEALQPDGLRGARALGKLSVARDTASFAMSDLLVARSAGAKAGGAPARWRDLNLLPSAGRFARGAPIALVWETYGLAAGADGSARYRVVIGVERKADSRARAVAQDLAARIVGGVAGMTGAQTQARRGKVTLSYDRRAPATPIALEYLTLDVSNAPPGRYEVTVTVTDLETKRVARGRRGVRIE